MSLLALIRKGGLAKAATATTATLAKQGGKKAGTVAIVATVAVASSTSPEAELTALVDRVADHHGFTTEQRREALEIALADAVAALECFRVLTAGICTPRP